MWLFVLYRDMGSSQQECEINQIYSKGTYKKYTSTCHFQIAKYANETGCGAAVWKFKSLFPELNKSMVCGFPKKYLNQMNLAEKRNRSPEKSIVNLQPQRPLVLGNDNAEKVRKYIMTLQYKGGKATFSIVIAVPKALIEQGVIKVWKSWNLEKIEPKVYSDRWVLKNMLHNRTNNDTWGHMERSQTDLPVQHCNKNLNL